MRIGVDIRTLQDKYYSGIPEYTFQVLKEMLKQDKKNTYVLYYNSFKDLNKRLKELDLGNIEVVRTSYPNKFFGILMQGLLKWPKIDRLLDVDVFFMPHLNYIALSKEAKLVLTIHDLSFDFFPEMFSLKKNIWHRSINLKKLLERSQKVIAVSQNTKKDIVDRYGISEKKIKSIYSGISGEFGVMDDEKKMDEVRDKYGLRNKFIFSLSTIEPRKNLLGLIKAYENLMDRAEINDMDLVISGAYGWKSKKVYRARERSRYRDRIIFTSYIDSEDKKYFYNMAEVFVYPSFYEGFGFPPLEALRCGTRVVLGANSSLLELFSDGVYYVDPFNIVSIERGVLAALKQGKQNREEREKLSASVEKYQWSKTAKETLNLIESLNS